MPQPDTTGAAESRFSSMANPHIPKQPAKNPTDPDKVSRVARKSPVNGFDMQRFFGTHLRPEIFVDLPQKICKEGPAVKPRSTGASNDLGLPHELVEAILSHLPIFDLIVATGINMTFRTIVQNSPMLQRNLFLRPIQGPPRYVQVEHPDYGRRTIVAGQSGVDEYYDGKDSRTERICRALHDTVRASAGPGQEAGWQWSRELAVVNLCPFLLHNLGEHERSASARFLYIGGEQVHFSGLAALAEHWANMYLTNPPCKEVIAQMSYQDDITGHYNILAHRTIYCESDVKIASLMDVLHMEGGCQNYQSHRAGGLEC